MAIVTLRGRFKPGALVQLVKVRDESVLRAEGGEIVEEKTVDESGCVQFSRGVQAGGRYFVVGQIDGHPTEVRVRGNEPDDDNPVLVHQPVTANRQKLANGQWQDELVQVGAPRVAPVKGPEMSGVVAQSPEAAEEHDPEEDADPDVASHGAGRKPVEGDPDNPIDEDRTPAPRKASSRRVSADRSSAKRRDAQASGDQSTKAKSDLSSARKEK